MFTGLIEHLSTVASVDIDEGGATLTISQSGLILGDCHIGDSIAVNGACLTVTEFEKGKNGGWFKVWLANETLDRTDLGERVVGDQVNLERAMAAHTRPMSTERRRLWNDNLTSDGESIRFTFQFPPPTSDQPSLLPYIIPKGYTTIDGTSLTVTEVNDAEHTFGIMTIKHTQEVVALPNKPIGSKVNVEVDMVGKCVLKGVEAALSSAGSLDDTVSNVFPPTARQNAKDAVFRLV